VRGETLAVTRFREWCRIRQAVTNKPERKSYRHGNVHAEAVAAALTLVVEGGHEALSLRRVADAVGIAHRSLYNHFESREALLDAVAEEGFTRLAAKLETAHTTDGYVEKYVRFALANARLFDLMKSRPHATMKQKPSLQRAVHLGITPALRLFGEASRTPEENRRAVMKVLILLSGGIALHQAGILDVEGDRGLIRELQAMVKSSSD
jgi:AcrR family transcriptional regulator